MIILFNKSFKKDLQELGNNILLKFCRLKQIPKGTVDLDWVDKNTILPTDLITVSGIWNQESKVFEFSFRLDQDFLKDNQDIIGSESEEEPYALEFLYSSITRPDGIKGTAFTIVPADKEKTGTSYKYSRLDLCIMSEKTNTKDGYNHFIVHFPEDTKANIYTEKEDETEYLEGYSYKVGSSIFVPSTVNEDYILKDSYQKYNNRLKEKDSILLKDNGERVYENVKYKKYKSLRIYPVSLSIQKVKKTDTYLIMDSSGKIVISGECTYDLYERVNGESRLIQKDVKSNDITEALLFFTKDNSSEDAYILDQSDKSFSFDSSKVSINDDLIVELRSKFGDNILSNTIDFVMYSGTVIAYSSPYFENNRHVILTGSKGADNCKSLSELEYGQIIVYSKNNLNKSNSMFLSKDSFEDGLVSNLPKKQLVRDAWYDKFYNELITSKTDGLFLIDNITTIDESGNTIESGPNFNDYFYIVVTPSTSNGVYIYTLKFYSKNTNTGNSWIPTTNASKPTLFKITIGNQVTFDFYCIQKINSPLHCFYNNQDYTGSLNLEFQDTEPLKLAFFGSIGDYDKWTISEDTTKFVYIEENNNNLDPNIYADAINISSLNDNYAVKFNISTQPGIEPKDLGYIIVKRTKSDNYSENTDWRSDIYSGKDSEIKINISTKSSKIVLNNWFVVSDTDYVANYKNSRIRLYLFGSGYSNQVETQYFYFKYYVGDNDSYDINSMNMWIEITDPEKESLGDYFNFSYDNRAIYDESERCYTITVGISPKSVNTSENCIPLQENTRSIIPVDFSLVYNEYNSETGTNSTVPLCTETFTAVIQPYNSERPIEIFTEVLKWDLIGTSNSVLSKPERYRNSEFELVSELPGIENYSEGDLVMINNDQEQVISFYELQGTGEYQKLGSTETEEYKIEFPDTEKNKSIRLYLAGAIKNNDNYTRWFIMNKSSNIVITLNSKSSNLLNEYPYNKISGTDLYDFSSLNMSLWNPGDLKYITVSTTAKTDYSNYFELKPSLKFGRTTQSNTSIDEKTSSYNSWKSLMYLGDATIRTFISNKNINKNIIVYTDDDFSDTSGVLRLTKLGIYRIYVNTGSAFKVSIVGDNDSIFYFFDWDRNIIDRTSKSKDYTQFNNSDNSGIPVYFAYLGGESKAFTEEGTCRDFPKIQISIIDNGVFYSKEVSLERKYSEDDYIIDPEITNWSDWTKTGDIAYSSQIKDADETNKLNKNNLFLKESDKSISFTIISDIEIEITGNTKYTQDITLDRSLFTGNSTGYSKTVITVDTSSDKPERTSNPDSQIKTYYPLAPVEYFSIQHPGNFDNLGQIFRLYKIPSKDISLELDSKNLDLVTKPDEPKYNTYINSSEYQLLGLDTDYTGKTYIAVKEDGAKFTLSGVSRSRNDDKWTISFSVDIKNNFTDDEFGKLKVTSRINSLVKDENGVINRTYTQDLIDRIIGEFNNNKIVEDTKEITIINTSNGNNLKNSIYSGELYSVDNLEEKDDSYVITLNRSDKTTLWGSDNTKWGFDKNTLNLSIGEDQPATLNSGSDKTSSEGEFTVSFKPLLDFKLKSEDWKRVEVSSTEDKSGSFSYNHALVYSSLSNILDKTVDYSFRLSVSSGNKNILIGPNKDISTNGWNKFIYFGGYYENSKSNSLKGSTIFFCGNYPNDNKIEIKPVSGVYDIFLVVYSCEYDYEKSEFVFTSTDFDYNNNNTSRIDVGEIRIPRDQITSDKSHEILSEKLSEPTLRVSYDPRINTNFNIDINNSLSCITKKKNHSKGHSNCLSINVFVNKEEGISCYCKVFASLDDAKSAVDNFAGLIKYNNNDINDNMSTTSSVWRYYWNSENTAETQDRTTKNLPQELPFLYFNADGSRPKKLLGKSLGNDDDPLYLVTNYKSKINPDNDFGYQDDFSKFLISSTTSNYLSISEYEEGYSYDERESHNGFTIYEFNIKCRQFSGYYSLNRGKYNRDGTIDNNENYAHNYITLPGNNILWVLHSTINIKLSPPIEWAWNDDVNDKTKITSGDWNAHVGALNRCSGRINLCKSAARNEDNHEGNNSISFRKQYRVNSNSKDKPNPVDFVNIGDSDIITDENIQKGYCRFSSYFSNITGINDLLDVTIDDKKTNSNFSSASCGCPSDSENYTVHNGYPNLNLFYHAGFIEGTWIDSFVKPSDSVRDYDRNPGLPSSSERDGNYWSQKSSVYTEDHLPYFGDRISSPITGFELQAKSLRFMEAFILSIDETYVDLKSISIKNPDPNTKDSNGKNYIIFSGLDYSELHRDKYNVSVIRTNGSSTYAPMRLAKISNTNNIISFWGSNRLDPGSTERVNTGVKLDKVNYTIGDYFTISQNTFKNTDGTTNIVKTGSTPGIFYERNPNSGIFKYNSDNQLELDPDTVGASSELGLVINHAFLQDKSIGPAISTTLRPNLRRKLTIKSIDSSGNISGAMTFYIDLHIVFCDAQDPKRDSDSFNHEYDKLYNND